MAKIQADQRPATYVRAGVRSTLLSRARTIKGAQESERNPKEDQPEHGDDRYRWLNDRIGAVVGEVRPRDGGGFSVAIEVREILWEQLGTNA